MQVFQQCSQACARFARQESHLVSGRARVERSSRTSRCQFCCSCLLLFHLVFSPPQDLVSLGIMCGMQESDARDAVFTNCEILLPFVFAVVFSSLFSGHLCLERGFLRSKTWRSAVGVERDTEALSLKLEDAFSPNVEEEDEKKKKKKKKKSKKNKKEKSESSRSVKKQKKTPPINFE
jgi:hypothetical protein